MEKPYQAIGSRVILVNAKGEYVKDISVSNMVMAKRIAAALNLVRFYTTDQIGEDDKYRNETIPFTPGSEETMWEAATLSDWSVWEAKNAMEQAAERMKTECPAEFKAPKPTFRSSESE